MTYYQGGKKRLGKEISSVILDIEKQYTNEQLDYFEPFCGMLGVCIHIIKNNPDRKIRMNDYNPDIVSLWTSVQKGWKPPTVVSKEFFLELKDSKVSSPERGFVGFACSYNGNMFGGFRTDHFLSNSVKSVNEYSKYIKNVEFLNKSYDDYVPKNKLIYCDPPYINNQLTYNKYFKNFDTEKFWNVMREWSKDNYVIISEYIAPEDFQCIWEKSTSFASGTKNVKTTKRIEKLFMLKN